jgi:alanine-glyoxylate transaminase/serine-glyoxylate transaminase/serine-pyruvate transaminase
VLAAMHRAAPNIYEGDLIAMTAGLIPDLRAVARTAHQAVIYIGNGHAVWEAALANVLSRGDRVLVPATGRFGHGWAEMARGLGVEAEVIDFGPERTWDTARIEERLAADRDGRIRAVLAVHVDTASSVRNDVAGLRAAMDRAGHPALLMADCIASLGCDRFEMDGWGVDVMVAASQKGLMVPPGLGFVFFNDRADRARNEADCVTRYWDWRPRADPQEYWHYFDGTAPTHHLYGLRVALDMIKAEGIGNVWRRHEVLAQAIWAAFGVWSRGGAVRLNLADAGLRSHAVTAAHAGAPDAARLRAWCEEMAGLTLGIGLGREPAEAWFRIGHMGHVNAPMVLGALATIEAGLGALGIAHAPGGVEAAAGVVARAARPG